MNFREHFEYSLADEFSCISQKDDQIRLRAILMQDGIQSCSQVVRVVIVSIEKESMLEGGIQEGQDLVDVVCHAYLGIVDDYGLVVVVGLVVDAFEEIVVVASLQSLASQSSNNTYVQFLTSVKLTIILPLIILPLFLNQTLQGHFAMIDRIGSQSHKLQSLNILIKDDLRILIYHLRSIVIKQPLCIVVIILSDGLLIDSMVFIGLLYLHQIFGGSLLQLYNRDNMFHFQKIYFGRVFVDGGEGR